jgi:hypothetical protein
MTDGDGFTALKSYAMVKNCTDSLKHAVRIGMDSRLFKGPAFFGFAERPAILNETAIFVYKGVVVRFEKDLSLRSR